MKVSIMGMTFDENNVPDFGSICLVSPDRLGVKSFRLNDDDVAKLDLLTDEVYNGSDALTSKGRLFIKLSGEWTEVTDDEQP